jgi:hypothetical protein
MIRIVKNRSYVVGQFLLLLAFAFALVALPFRDEFLLIWPNVWGYLEHGDVSVPVVLGRIPFGLALNFLGMIFFYLYFEFYGFKSAWKAVIGMLLSLTLLFFGFTELGRLQSLGILRLESTTEISWFGLDIRNFLALTLSLGAYWMVLITLASTLKKLTKNYFMFFRFFIAHTVAACLYISIGMYLQNFDKLAPESMALESLPYVAQLVLGSIGVLVPLYLIRLVLAPWKGSYQKPEKKKAKSLFKAPPPQAQESNLIDRDEEYTDHAVELKVREEQKNRADKLPWLSKTEQKTREQEKGEKKVDLETTGSDSNTKETKPTSPKPAPLSASVPPPQLSGNSSESTQPIDEELDEEDFNSTMTEIPREE